MRVLISGAAGVLGRAVASRLENDPDVVLRLTDMVPLDTPHEFVRADLSDPDQAAPLCEGVDQVMHIASIHPWKPYTPAQYIDCNIKGTYNILQAAAEGSVNRVVYTSSIAAMGMGRCEPLPLPWDESKPCTPDGHLYSVTKHVGEQFCELFRDQGRFSYVALRPGTFIPRPDDDPGFGLGLLNQWVHASDVAQAHVLALRSSVQNEAIIVTAGVPFTREDGPALLTDARSVVLKYFPRAAELEARGIALPATIERCYSVAKAQELLGYSPAITFGTWLASLDYA